MKTVDLLQGFNMKQSEFVSFNPITSFQIRYTNMKRFSIITLLFFTITITNGQVLPQVTGETIENKSLTFPADLKGKFSLLCFASSQKAESDLQSWLDPVYQ